MQPSRLHRLVQAAGLAFLVIASPCMANQAGVERIAAAELAASGAPGMAYAIVDQREIESGAHGYLRRGDGEPVTADTPFPVGSITKSFTALAIVQLAERGRLGLDDPLSRHLPAFANSAGADITLRQLLSHASGYSTVQGNLAHADPAGAPIDGVARLARLAPAHAPGSRWEYSNANYLLLGAVVQSASGMTYDAYLRAHVLDPLDIPASTSAPAVPHRPWFGHKRPFVSAPAASTDPAGGLVLGARDIAAYLAMMMNGRDDLVTASSKAMMMHPASDLSPFYGLGWFIDPETGSVYHGGLVPGAEALASMSPDRGKAVIVLVNANGGIGVGETAPLLYGVTAAALGLPPPADSGHWGRAALYWPMILLPVLFLAALAWAMRHRAGLVAKRASASGRFSLWFPVATTFAMTGFLLLVLPRMFGGSLATLRLYQPDFALCLTASAILGPLWALARLGLAYRDTSR